MWYRTMSPIYQRTGTCLCILVMSVCMICFLPLPAVGDTTTLDDFVYAVDPTYGYSVYSTTLFLTHTRYCLSMISGQWRDVTEVNRTQWEHWVTLYVPHFLLHDTALLHIDGGSNGSSPDFTDLDELAAPIAVLTGSVVVNLGQVPNQPLTFAGETQSRTEDALIAYSWKKFLEEPSDITWPAQLPMTRAAVRAMDAVQSFMSDVRPSNPIDHFVVAGASKRGWTTWLTAAAENGALHHQKYSPDNHLIYSPDIFKAKPPSKTPNTISIAESSSGPANTRFSSIGFIGSVHAPALMINLFPTADENLYIDVDHIIFIK